MGTLEIRLCLVALQGGIPAIRNIVSQGSLDGEPGATIVRTFSTMYASTDAGGRVVDSYLDVGSPSDD